MSRDDDTLLKLATAIVDGKAIGWEKAEEQAVTDQGRALFRQMRVLAEVERMSRELDPATWGHLEIREKVGEGTFGDVYRAWDPTLARDVALKLFKSTVVSAPGQADFANDVLKEGQLLARVQHPNVTAVYGAGIHDGRVGLWMELIRGRSLDQIVQEHGAMGAAEAVNIGLELCRALAAVHGQGLVHGDIKARNVMREDRGRIVLMDFGTGRDRRRANDTLRTLPHGTLCYMAPELLRGEEASPQSDIYSLGVLLFKLLTLSYPIEAHTLGELELKHTRGDTTLLRDLRADLPDTFVRVVEKALAPTAGERFSSAGEMERALSEVQQAQVQHGALKQRRTGAASSRAGSRRWLIAATVLIAVIALWPFAQRFVREPENLTERPPNDAAPRPTAGSDAIRATETFQAQATFFRRLPSGARRPLQPGSRLGVGDGLFLEFEASAETHVYVIDEDEQGRAYLLFPLDGFGSTNLLSAGARHVLPTTRTGAKVDWEVTSTGGREHLLIVASRERLVEFEAEMQRFLPAGATPTLSSLQLTPNAKRRLRGIGGVRPAPAALPGDAVPRLYELAQELTNQPESAREVWARYIAFENPAP